MNFKTIVTTGIILSSLVNPSHALESFTLYMLQSTLREHGYTQSEPDGLMGPATRAALLLFSKAYAAPRDADGAFQVMVSMSIAARRPVSKEEFLVNIKKGVAERLRDPSSAMLRNVYQITTAKNELVCGEVNGKNAYGAYAGYTPFYGIMLMEDFVLIHMDAPDDNIAELTCFLSFPIKR